MRLEEFRNRRYVKASLPNDQLGLVSRAQDYGISAYTFSKIDADISKRFAKTSAHMAFLAFSDLRIPTLFIEILKDAAEKRRATTTQPYATGEENDLVAYEEVSEWLRDMPEDKWRSDSIAVDCSVTNEFAEKVIEDVYWQENPDYMKETAL